MPAPAAERIPPRRGPRVPLDIALYERRPDSVGPPCEFGADPRRVELYGLYDTYDSCVFERFRAAGVDPAGDHDLALRLSEHTRNKPLFGFEKRHLGEYPALRIEPNLALGVHTREGNDREVILGLWAGADHHVLVHYVHYGSDSDEPEMQGTAVENAVVKANLPALEALKPDLSEIDFDSLYGRANGGEVVRALPRSSRPRT